MKWNQFIKDYLTFTRKERIGIIVLLFLILFIAFAPLFFPRSIKRKDAALDTAWINSMKKIEKKESENDNNSFFTQNKNEDNNAYQYDQTKNSYNTYKPKIELFYFDPNTITIDDWKKLGLRDKTIQIIQNYLHKGGHFNKPEDLQKIYGLLTNEYERLVPYIQINSIVSKKDESQPEKKITNKYSVIDINVADTAGFDALPGIGNKLASRIIKFREKLGGFYSIDQIEETFGLPDSTFQHIKQYLKLENTLIKKININTATIDELKTHPYIRWNIANNIVAYRNEHGNFLKLEDLKKIATVSEELYIKIVPYLTIH